MDAVTLNTKIVYSEKCLGYGAWHIEGPQRVKVAAEILKDKGYEFLEPTPGTEEDLLLVHDPEYLWKLKKGLVEDADTPAYSNIYEYARLSVGGALLASQIHGFSLMRPPGHHVGRYGAALGVYTRGFCYLNNIAIAVKKLGKKTLILDIDGHHGNGTQEFSKETTKSHTFPCINRPTTREPAIFQRETASTMFCRRTPKANYISKRLIAPSQRLISPKSKSSRFLPVLTLTSVI